MTSPSEYHYADGSGNRFVVAPSSIQYIPVTPKESSSGIYSGGEPKSATITRKQFEELSDLFDKGLGNLAAQQDDRAMMTGMITKVNANDSITVVLKPKSTEKLAIEERLKRLVAGN
jgi:hypothetical protein